MTDTPDLNLTTHRATASVWERSGWDGTREQLAITRWLVGIGGGALALQGLRQRTVAGSLLAGVGGGLAWWALTGEGDLSEARRWFGTHAGTCRMAGTGPRPRGVRRIVPGERSAFVDRDGRHRSRRAPPARDAACARGSGPVDRTGQTHLSRGPRRQLSRPGGAARLLFLSRAFSGAAVPRRARQLHSRSTGCSTPSPQRWRASRRARCCRSSRIRSQDCPRQERRPADPRHARHDLEHVVRRDRHHRHAQPGLRHSGGPAVVEGQGHRARPDAGAAAIHRRARSRSCWSARRSRRKSPRGCTSAPRSSGPGRSCSGRSCSASSPSRSR